jgi:hypothetical protein
MIEIDINKFPEYPEISNLLKGLVDHNKELQFKIVYLEEVIKKVMEFNSMGKTLKINELCATALENMEDMK